MLRRVKKKQKNAFNQKESPSFAILGLQKEEKDSLIFNRRKMRL